MKKQLTPAGQLAKAQVPPEEQPYALPKGWKWVRLGGIAELSKEKCDTFQVDDKYVGLEHMEKNGGAIDFGSAEGILSTKSVFHVGDVLYGKLRPYLNKHGIADFDGVCSTDVLVFKTSTFADKRWLNWSFDRLDFIRYAVENSKGVNLPRVSAKEVLQARVPLPPMEEQQRIVQRIESLFAKLDAAEVRLNAVAATFAPRKATLLHQAMQGKLTAKWRIRVGMAETSWHKRKLKECGTWFGGGTPSKAHPEYWEQGDILWITSKDMKADVITDTQLHINRNGVENSSANYIDQPAILFVMRSGILRHTFPVAITQGGFTVNQDLKGIIPDDDIDLKFLLYAMQADEQHVLDTCMKSGTTVESINTQALKDYEVSLPPLSEQRAIVAQLDHLLAREHQAAVAVTRARTELRRLRAAILARAFRGEL